MPSGDKIIESSLLNSLGAQVLRTIAARLIYNTCSAPGDAVHVSVRANPFTAIIRG